MTTGYLITLGYQSDSIDEEEGWQALERAADDLRHDDLLFNRMNGIVQAPLLADEYTPRDYADIYSKEPHEFSPISIYHEKHCIHISCSGGDPSRTMKEWAARCFCILLMIEMAKQGINISVSVS